MATDSRFIASILRAGVMVCVAALLGGCVNTLLGELHVMHARVHPGGEALKLVVARESRYSVEPSVNSVWKTSHYALHVLTLPAVDRRADWSTLEGESRKILSFNGAPPKGVDYHYAAGTLFTAQASALQWCAVQADTACKPVGAVPLTDADGRVAHDRDGRHFFVAHQLFVTDRALPLVNVSARPGYQQFRQGPLDRPFLVEHRWLLAASHHSKRPGEPLLHIYDMERDTVETILAQALPEGGSPELLAVDRDEQGWQLLIKQTYCVETGKNRAGGKTIACDDHYAVQRPGQPRLEPLDISPDKSALVSWRVDFGHWDARRKRLWLFDAINRYDQPHGIAVQAVRFQPKPHP